MKSRIDIGRIRESVGQIDPVFLDSRLFTSEELNERLRVELLLKDETRNPVGCFKGRGAEYLAARHPSGRPIICASAGNFGQAMAYACVRRGIPVTVYAAVCASPIKLERMCELGAEVVLFGDDFDAAKNEAKRVTADGDARFVEDSLDSETVEGAGTMGLELSAEAGALDALLIPLGNGAMFNGIATVFKKLQPTTRMIAVQAEGAPAMIDSWRARRVVSHDHVTTIADGLGVREPVPEAVDDMMELIDDGLLVSEAGILTGMRWLRDLAGVIVEPSGAVGVAAVLESSGRFAGQRIATVLCGGNVSEDQVKEWIP
jgi:threonine dehydratase